jgi:hypothetical protein
MSDDKAKKIIERFKRLKAKRVNWEDQWQDIGKYVIPRKDNIYDFNHIPGGEKKRVKLYDGSAEHFNELLASALHSMLTNPTQPWFELSTGDPALDQKNRVREYLQRLGRRIHEILNNSNFQTEIHEVYLDLGGFGTGHLRMEEDNELVVRFKSDPIYRHHVAENEKGEIDTDYNEVKMSVRNILKKYGKDVFANSPKKQSIENDIHKEYTVLQEVIPKADIDVKRGGKKFLSSHVLVEEEMLLKEKGFNEFPYAVPRWNKNSGEIYGRSPGMKAMPDIKMLNAIMRDTIRSAQKVTDPPLMVPDDNMGSPIDMTPGGINPYRAGTQDRIFPLETRGQPRIGFDVMQDVRNRVKASFFIDQLQLREADRMTATEVNQRTDEHLRLLGPILGRMNFELLQPLITRVIGIMKRKKLLPPDVPQELQDIQLEVFYSSQIAKAQRLAEANNFNRFVASMAPLAEVQPEVNDNFDFDIAAKKLARLHGVDEEILIDDEDVESAREERASQQAQEQAQQQQMLDAETISKVGSTAAKFQGA